jgi:mannose-6-phosphate isomerase-like protein (cupin superfamily)
MSVEPTEEEPDGHTLDQDEVLVVISGSVRVTPGGEKLGPGDAQVVPAGTPIAFVNTDNEAAQLYASVRAGFTVTLADGTTFPPPWAQ